MIRANLLPRPKERVGLGGIDFDAEYLRQVIVSLAIVAAITLAGIGIESLRAARLEAAAMQQDELIATNAARRNAAKVLALEVARYQSFAREAQAYRRSGADAAFALAKIGNSVPDRVWLTSLDHQTAGYDVVGGARSVDALGSTMLSLSHALPDTNAKLVNIDNHNASGVRFTARVAANATPEPVAVAPHREPLGVAPSAPTPPDSAIRP